MATIARSTCSHRGSCPLPEKERAWKPEPCTVNARPGAGPFQTVDSRNRVGARPPMTATIRRIERAAMDVYGELTRRHSTPNGFSVAKVRASATACFLLPQPHRTHTA